MDLVFLAGGLGFEPRLEESESSVLPLNDPPMEGGNDITHRWGTVKRFHSAAVKCPSTGVRWHEHP